MKPTHARRQGESGQGRGLSGGGPVVSLRGQGRGLGGSAGQVCTLRSNSRRSLNPSIHRDISFGFS
jgi:hypothetical protein